MISATSDSLPLIMSHIASDTDLFFFMYSQILPIWWKNKMADDRHLLSVSMIDAHYLIQNQKAFLEGGDLHKKGP